jgi:hypothetical protein
MRQRRPTYCRPVLDRAMLAWEPKERLGQARQRHLIRNAPIYP